MLHAVRRSAGPVFTVVRRLANGALVMGGTATVAFPVAACIEAGSPLKINPERAALKIDLEWLAPQLIDMYTIDMWTVYGLANVSLIVHNVMRATPISAARLPRLAFWLVQMKLGELASNAGMVTIMKTALYWHTEPRSSTLSTRIYQDAWDELWTLRGAFCRIGCVRNATSGTPELPRQAFETHLAAQMKAKSASFVAMLDDLTGLLEGLEGRKPLPHVKPSSLRDGDASVVCSASQLAHVCYKLVPRAVAESNDAISFPEFVALVLLLRSSGVETTTTRELMWRTIDVYRTGAISRDDLMRWAHVLHAVSDEACATRTTSRHGGWLAMSARAHVVPSAEEVGKALCERLGATSSEVRLSRADWLDGYAARAEQVVDVRPLAQLLREAHRQGAKHKQELLVPPAGKLGL